MVISEHLKKYNADEMLFFLAVILKPLYLLPSGSFQVGDFLFLAAVAIHFFAGSERDLLFPIHKEEHSLLIFIAGVLVINCTYWIIIGTADFLVNSSYYVFNFLIVLFAVDVIQSNRKIVFLQGLSNSCKVVILFQLLCYIAGAGQKQLDGRYIGTFNDPNQFSVCVLFCMFIVLDIHHKIDLKAIIWFLLCVALIIPSGSTGSLMSAAIFAVLALFISVKNINKKSILIGIAGVLSVIVLFLLAQSAGKISINTNVIGLMRSRLEGKLNNVTGFGDMLRFLINDRIWNRIFEQPKYLLYGSGEGAHSRFDAYYISHEIHSSILGPPFYYGIGIAFFVFRWAAIKLKHIDAFQFCIYAAMITEALLLVNYRQPLFWLLFVLAGRDKTDESEVSCIDKTEYIDPVIVQKV